jgi:hypothetical protein
MRNWSRIITPALPPQPFSEDQVGAGEFDTKPGTTESFDGFAAELLSCVTVTDQRTRTRLDAPRPIGGAGAGERSEAMHGIGRHFGHTAAGGCLNELDGRQRRHAQMVGMFHRTLGQRGGLPVSSEGIVQQGVRVFSDSNADSLAAKNRVSYGRRGQHRCRRSVTA